MYGATCRIFSITQDLQVPSPSSFATFDSTLDAEQVGQLPDLASDDENFDFDPLPGPANESDLDTESDSKSDSEPDGPGREAEEHHNDIQQQPAPTTQHPKSLPLRISLQFIEALEAACHENSMLAREDDARLWNPPRECLNIGDPALRQALKTFMGADSPITEETFNAIRDAAIERHPLDDFPSFYKTKTKLAELTGICPLETDMCLNSCIAYTGPFTKLNKCPYPTCHEPQYDQAKLAKGVQEARTKFWTIPIGPYLQSLWRNPETAKELKFRREVDKKIHLKSTTKPKEWDDITAGADYEKLVENGTIELTDMILMFSIDASDCWIYIWVILDFRPGLRYKKKVVVPGGFIPGPNPPKNVDSFTFREGLPIWDASSGESFISHPYLLLSTADGPGQQHMSGSNGHTARRHRYGAPQYYPVTLKPMNSEYLNEASDVDIQKDLRTSLSSEASIQEYHTAITNLLGSRTQTDYKMRQTQCGFGKPSILSGLPRCLGPPGVFPADLMHYILNIGDLLSGLWTGKLDKIYPPDNVDTWPWRVLVGDRWTQHGEAVAHAHHFFPDNFDRVPRNPAEKINSGYKAKEWQHWLFGLGPALLYGLLPHEYWLNFCKLVHVIRLLHQYSISQKSLVTAYQLILEFTYEFETLYYQRRVERLHFVRHSIHTPMHIVQEVLRVANPILYAQWTLERTIGNLGGEIRQPKHITRKETALPTGGIDVDDGYQFRPKIDNAARPVLDAAELDALKVFLSSKWNTPFEDKKHNSRITRAARLYIPENSQVARSRWAEKEHNRVTRMVQLKSNMPEGFEIGEVHYFFRYDVQKNIPTALAMVKVFGIPDRALLQESFETLWVARPGEAGMRVIPAKSILSVVAMIPFSENRGGELPPPQFTPPAQLLFAKHIISPFAVTFALPLLVLFFLICRRISSLAHVKPVHGVRG
ncbi:hypothetical protein DFH08DRAFT_910784 [Mycena albidolilacea]|uniref:Transposase family Tnp2 protein n=1 Tax=Mycena albidolilacea TaxID=1033008 RepID=A0AAD7F0I2_9AGAR|nr:hypothetical protein DFH08DRAFT_910784 [Mycena albidolilacea]